MCLQIHKYVFLYPAITFRYLLISVKNVRIVLYCYTYCHMYVINHTMSCLCRINVLQLINVRNLIKFVVAIKIIK